jgi:hypothetical protein
MVSRHRQIGSADGTLNGIGKNLTNVYGLLPKVARHPSAICRTGDREMLSSRIFTIY